MSERHHGPYEDDHIGEAFETVEALWFWFMAANEAMRSGARYSAGRGDKVRPCEPVDVIRIVERLYRSRMLKIDHLRVMRHYGLRKSAPDPYVAREARAAKIWDEAMDKLYPVLLRKKLVEPRPSTLAEWPQALKEQALARAEEIGRWAKSGTQSNQDNFSLKSIEGGLA